jgi:hypothetical protein
MNTQEIINIFTFRFKQLGWTLTAGGNVVLISHGNFHYECESTDEVIKVLDLLRHLAPCKTREQWHENAKAKLTDVENAKQLLADFKLPVSCKFNHKSEIKLVNYA